jgi:hypothetical protein
LAVNNKSFPASNNTDFFQRRVWSEKRHPKGENGRFPRSFLHLLCRCNCPSIELDIGAGRSACRPKLYAKHHCVVPSSVVQGKDKRRSLKTSMIVEEWSSAPRLWEMIRALTASLAFLQLSQI